MSPALKRSARYASSTSRVVPARRAGSPDTRARKFGHVIGAYAMHNLRNLLEDLRSSLWFVPTLLVTEAVVLVVGVVEVDSYIIRERLTGQ